MISDRELGDQGAMVSSLDLQQIKEAMSELRALSPESVLADLVEEKIRALENGHPTPHFDSSSA